MQNDNHQFKCPDLFGRVVSMSGTSRANAFLNQLQQFLLELPIREQLDEGLLKERYLVEEAILRYGAVTDA